VSIPAAMRAVLERARETGLLGPGPIEPHFAHAEGFAVAAEDARGSAPASFADLGTGGGVPGLVLAERWTRTEAVFIEVGQRRAEFLREAAADLGLGMRVEVREDRAETVGRDPALREHFELVTARSFAAPAVTAEVAAGLVAVGGLLIVSEPPETDPSRWPGDRLQLLGFGPAQVVEIGAAHFATLPKAAAVAGHYPRAVGRPAKRPLW
jgi:16S rRNA (guanine527-N7)-methyltransferase